ncbi:MAG: enoyl-CoA hydratase, partial [Rhodospirillaceae bacterium]
ATLTLNRPEAGNTITLPLAQALFEVSLRCERDKAIRCVVLTGRGKLFCGGGDVAVFAEIGANLPNYLGELAKTLNMALSHLMRMPKPLLALVNGSAAGAGLSLAISADIVIAGSSARFLAAYGEVGLSPDGGMTWLLPRLVGMRRAQEIIIANKIVGAAEALEIGLVTEVVDDSNLTEIGHARALSLANSATEAIGGARQLLLGAFDGAYEDHLEREAVMISNISRGPECREGIDAFRNRRKPNFFGDRG